MAILVISFNSFGCLAHVSFAFTSYSELCGRHLLEMHMFLTCMICMEIFLSFIFGTSCGKTEREAYAAMLQTFFQFFSSNIQHSSTIDFY
jgi:hypothetical protein